MTTVLIPTPLRRLTGGQAKVDVPGDTVDQVINNLEVSYPGMGERLLDGDEMCIRDSSLTPAEFTKHDWTHIPQTVIPAPR